MDFTILTLTIAVIGCVLSIATFVLNRKDKAIKDSKENHQELIEYQLKELKEDMIYNIVTHEQMEQIAYKVGD